MLLSMFISMCCIGELSLHPFFCPVLVVFLHFGLFWCFGPKIHLSFHTSPTFYILQDSAYRKCQGFMCTSKCCWDGLSLQPWFCHLLVVFLLFGPFWRFGPKSHLSFHISPTFYLYRIVPMGNARLYVYLEVLLWRVAAATIVLPLVGCFLTFWPLLAFWTKKPTYIPYLTHLLFSRG